MKKNILKTGAILLSLASIITVFAACSKTDENTLLYEEDGKIFYRKEAGDDAYELVTDANGVTVVDEQGNMLWKVTDVDGQDQTHPVSFPAFINDGKTVSCQQFTLTLPKGWENTGNLNLILKNVDENMTIMYSFLEKESEDYLPIEGNIQKIEESFKTLTDAGKAVLTETQVQVAGRDATKLIVETTEEGNESYMEVYYVDIGTGTMNFMCNCDYEDKGFNFKAIVDSIEYRV